jgi:hypothetical protein
MQYQVYDLGNVKSGEAVEITLSGNAANVRLMDSSNYQNYRNGKNHRYVGGLATKSPVRLQVPNSGHWYVTVDLQGLRGSVRSSIRKVPGSLPEMRMEPLSSVPSLVQEKYHPTESAILPREYDVFISHASEDKDEVVRPLAIALRSLNLRVWFDEFELRIGDSLRRKIDQGLSNSRFGIVVLSKDFIKKGWTNYELDGIITKAVSGEQVVLPIWHNISKSEVMQFSPSLVDNQISIARHLFSKY